MTSRERIVVIGNGMAGARFVEEVVQRAGNDRFEMVVFGNEPHGNYNRILLSGVLAGTQRPQDIFINPLAWYEEQKIRLHAGVQVEKIDLDTRTVRGSDGTEESFHKLVIATGSSPFVPPIDGIRKADGELKDGVFVFRTLEDCRRISERAAVATTAVVIGGGLLGLEAARGLLGLGLQVHVVHLTSHVMDMQLDSAAGAILLKQLEGMGLHVRLRCATARITGDEAIDGLIFADGSGLACDLLVVAAGIRPNVDLARDAGLHVERGIVVGDDLAVTGKTDVFAIGECAQHRGSVYGLVAPLWEQAECLAKRMIAAAPSELYQGSRTSTKLKVAGVDVAVMGEKDPSGDDEVVTYAEPARGIYKKVIIRQNRLAGAIVVGDGSVVPTLLQSFSDEMTLGENRAEILFSSIDSVIPSSETPGFEAMPDEARICDCNGVSKARIVEAILSGARSLSSVCEITRAGTGCGSCRPEVQALIAATCEELAAGEVETVVAPPPGVARIERVSGSLNKIERLKQEKDGLDILEDLPRIAANPWTAIDEGDRERLKWAGVFYRKQTPGRFMMRIRIPNGLSNSRQLRAIADISREYGADFVDITTRQQIQLRGFEIGSLEPIWNRLEAVGLSSVQTGMDNVRNVVGCALAGLSANELFDASPVARDFTAMFLRNKEYTNLPRKLNVAITGCLDNCIHAETQDIALTPAVSRTGAKEQVGFNVAVGGKMGSGGHRMATPLDVFVRPEEAADLCGHITLLFRDHGGRVARSRARLAFLIEDWGIERFRAELQKRVGRPLASAGKDARTSRSADHLGAGKQQQPGLNYVGVVVPVGRIGIRQLAEIARLADLYGNGDVRVSVAQNLIVPNVPDEKLSGLLAEDLLAELSPKPSGIMRGLVSCTGIDYCHLALVETKELAMKMARHLEDRVGRDRMLTMHWSGCPAGCGNHSAADVGLLGKNIRVNGEVVEAVDVFVGGSAGPNGRPGTKLLEDIPCDDLPVVLERLIPYMAVRKAAKTREPQEATA